MFRILFLAAGLVAIKLAFVFGLFGGMIHLAHMAETLSDNTPAASLPQGDVHHGPVFSIGAAQHLGARSK